MSMWPSVTGSNDPGHTAPLTCAAPHRYALHRRRLGSSAPLLLIATLCIVAGLVHRRRSSSSLRSASSPTVMSQGLHPATVFARDLHRHRARGGADLPHIGHRPNLPV